MVSRQPASFHATATRAGDDVVVDLAGDLDLHTAPRLRALVEEALSRQADVERVVLDMAGVGFVDSSGLGAMLAAQRLAEGSDAHLLVRRPGERLQSMLRITGLDRVLTTG